MVKFVRLLLSSHCTVDSAPFTMKDSAFSVENLQQRLNALVYYYNASSNVPVLVFLCIALISCVVVLTL